MESILADFREEAILKYMEPLCQPPETCRKENEIAEGVGPESDATVI